MKSSLSVVGGCILLSLFCLGTQRVAAVTFTVNNTGDTGVGTLRQAILDANAHSGTDKIAFNIPGSGVHTITPASPLPDITAPVTIDGYTQPGASPNTLAVGDDALLLIQLNGSIAGMNAIGLNITGGITGGNCTVRGLCINRFRLEIFANTCDSNVIEGNFIGLDVSGTANLGNTGHGMAFYQSSDNLIGGTSPAARNVICAGDRGISLGGGGTNTIQGNYIGTDATGTLGLALFTEAGIFDTSSGTLIGGTTAGARNVLCGAAGGNIVLFGSNTTIQGNYVGLDATGTQVLGTSGEGIQVGAGHTLIGGTEPGARNVISGNHGRGVFGGAMVQGNYIGTDASGTVALGNDCGVVDAGLIGGTTAAARNVISGNKNGVLTADDSVLVQGNYIGTDASGVNPLPNQYGVVLAFDSFDITIGGTAAGAGNVIAFNSRDGVVVQDTATRTSIRGNSIHDNGGLGINLRPGGEADSTVTPNDAGDFDDGPNGLQNFPVVAAALPNGSGTTVRGKLNSTSNVPVALDFYANATADPPGFGEGRDYLGTAQVNTDGSGLATFDVSLPVAVPRGQFITATATDGDGTSEFSQARIVDYAIRITDATVSEGNTGAAPAQFVVTLTAPSPQPVKVDFQTADGTATAGLDYTSLVGTLTFQPGQTAKTISVPVKGDGLDESNETFRLVLAHPANAILVDGLGVGTIIDDDLLPTVFINNVTVVEGNSGVIYAPFLLQLSSPSGRTVTVTLKSADGTATAGADYVAVGSTTRTFVPGQTTKTLTVAIKGDLLAESDENFRILLQSATFAVIGDNLGVGTIKDNDGPASLVDDAS